MRAVVVREFGGLEALELSEVDAPTAGAGRVLVRVSVSGLNFVDVYNRTGLYPLPLPFIGGVEGVGSVVALGEGVTDFVVGQRVGWLSGGQGSFADLVPVLAEKAVPIPDDVDDVTAVALLMHGLTAHYLATDTFRITPGAVAIVHAAAGGVGQVLTQMIKILGGTVIATASTEAKRELALAAGADHALAYDGFAEAARELTGGAGVHVVYDGVGAATFEGGLAALAPRGTMVCFGNASGPVPPLDVLQLMRAGSLYVTRPTVAHYARTAGELRGRMADVFRWLSEGSLRVPPPTRFALEDVAAAFAALESRRTTGKLVLMH